MISKFGKSIRSKLLLWVLAPLSVLCIISSIIAYIFAVSFSNDASDRELLSTADSIAARLVSDGENVYLELPELARAILGVIPEDRSRFFESRTNKFKSKTEDLYYEVLKLDRTTLIGDKLPPPPSSPVLGDNPIFRYAIYNGQKLRIVRIKVEVPGYPEPLIVRVAESLDERKSLAGQIMTSIVVPQIIMLLFGWLLVSFGISRVLAPLNEISGSVSRRSQYDLTPLKVEKVPEEARPLILSINALLNRLMTDIETQKRFVANAAHQLRTPVAGLKTYIYAARTRSTENEVIELLDLADTGVDRITNLSNKLLALARAEPGLQLGTFGEIDLNLVAAEVIAELETLAREKNQHLDLEPSDSPAIVFGDSMSLGDLIANLVENAIFYTQENGLIKIKISGWDRVTLRVEDNGPGIAAHEREKVFERFYRILGSNVEGSGLGLSIVKEIVNSHRASIHLEAGSQGNGCAFIVDFPDAFQTQKES